MRARTGVRDAVAARGEVLRARHVNDAHERRHVPVGLAGGAAEGGGHSSASSFCGTAVWLKGVAARPSVHLGSNGHAG